MNFEANSLLTTISYYAFNKTGLESITLPPSITNIVTYGFKFSESLTSISFGSGSQLAEIGKQAFYQSVLLQTITLPEKLTNIVDRAFQKCLALATVSFEEGSMILANGSGGTIDSLAFDQTILTTVNVYENTRAAMNWTIGSNQPFYGAPNDNVTINLLS